MTLLQLLDTAWELALKVQGNGLFIFLSCNLCKYLYDLINTNTHSIANSRPSSVVERVAFNHVVVGSIPTDGGMCYYYFNFYMICFVLAGTALHAPLKLWPTKQSVNWPYNFGRCSRISKEVCHFWKQAIYAFTTKLLINEKT